MGTTSQSWRSRVDRSTCPRPSPVGWHSAMMRRWTRERAPAMKTLPRCLSWTTSQTKTGVAHPPGPEAPSNSIPSKLIYNRRRIIRWYRRIASLWTPACHKVHTQTPRWCLVKTARLRLSRSKERRRKLTKNHCLIWANQLLRSTRCRKRSTSQMSLWWRGRPNEFSSAWRLRHQPNSVLRLAKTTFYLNCSVRALHHWPLSEWKKKKNNEQNLWPRSPTLASDRVQPILS